MTTPERFFAVMSLTFEAANLDFAKYYEEIFKFLMIIKLLNNKRFMKMKSHVALV